DRQADLDLLRPVIERHDSSRRREIGPEPEMGGSLVSEAQISPQVFAVVVQPELKAPARGERGGVLDRGDLVVRRAGGFDAGRGRSRPMAGESRVRKPRASGVPKARSIA